MNAVDGDGYGNSVNSFDLLLICNVVFISAYENLEDDKKRGRSTDSEISQVRKKNCYLYYNPFELTPSSKIMLFCRSHLSRMEIHLHIYPRLPHCHPHPREPLQTL